MVHAKAATVYFGSRAPSARSTDQTTNRCESPSSRFATMENGPMFPQTPAATAALSVAGRYYSPALLNHCMRAYLWGTTYAAAHDIDYDDELYYVAAMLHDIGL